VVKAVYVFAFEGFAGLNNIIDVDQVQLQSILVLELNLEEDEPGEAEVLLFPLFEDGFALSEFRSDALKEYLSSESQL